MSRAPEAGSGAALVSGGCGFAGRHLVQLLSGRGFRVAAPSRAELDFRDADAVRRLVAEETPTAVFHLAAFSSPSLALEQPGEALLGNLEMALNVLEAVRRESPEAVVVLVGSGQVYGRPRSLPLTEDAPMTPDNPYAVSKASSDLLGRQYAEAHGMSVVRMRPFNHAGPGQSDHYVLGSIARQVAEAEVTGAGECVLRTGNPDVARDFTDVRDVVRAYVEAAAVGSGAFNVCSGSAVSIAELVALAASSAKIPIRHEVDDSRLRAADTPILYGSHERLTAATGWTPEIPLEQTLRDARDLWRERLGAQALPSSHRATRQ
jgi:GDP-4-dehydro-6-deoxy-D-mannose reductase